MNCKKCGGNKRLKQLFESVTNYKEILGDRIDGKDRYEYMDRAFNKDESIEELCEDFPYICVKRTLKGIMCLTCNEINVIEVKEYYNEFTEEYGETTNTIYPTKNMQMKYDEDMKKIPEKVYKTYMRAREADNDNKDVALFLLRKTLEMLLKDINADGGNLKTRIENVNNKLDVIENGMHKVRQAGNIAVHEEDIDFTDNEIQSMAENIENILKLFYVL